MPDQMTPDTLPAWLYQRFARTATVSGWDDLSGDDQSYWAHHAAAVRRAVARGGFKNPVAAPTAALTVTRTSAEMLARIEAAEDDFLGWVPEVLLPYMDLETARPMLKDGVTEQDWAEYAKAPEEVGADARSYYQFALGKIADERGISAERSVVKLREFAWLMGRNDVVAAMDAAAYPQYGAPKVAAFGEAFGFDTEAGAR